MSDLALLAALPPLELIERMRRQSRANLERLATWPAIEPHAERLDALDVHALARALVPDLVKSFGFWIDPVMTGPKNIAPIQAVVFEWSEDDDDALAYGFRSCQPKSVGPILGVDFVDWTLDGATFHDCGGFSGLAAVHAKVESETAFVDYQIMKVAEVTHHALAQAVTSTAFAALEKTAPLFFLVQRHDRFPVLAFRWPT